MKPDAGLITPLPTSDSGSAAVWGSKRIKPRPQSCLCLTWNGCPSNDDDNDDDCFYKAQMCIFYCYTITTFCAYKQNAYTFVLCFLGMFWNSVLAIRNFVLAGTEVIVANRTDLFRNISMLNLHGKTDVDCHLFRDRTC